MILTVLIGGRIAGSLQLSDSGAQPAFRYEATYQRDARIPLSVMIPLASRGGAGEHLYNWLLGVLPDDPEVLGALCAECGLSDDEALRLLGTPMGADCAGAVQFCRSDQVDALLSDPGRFELVDDYEIAEWLDRMEVDPVRRAYRTDNSDSGFSIAGMQPKVALRWTSDGWAVPNGSLPTTHIIKAARNDRWRNEHIIEHLTMNVAARCGIAAAHTSIGKCSHRDVLIVERYDRHPDGMSRLHQEDLCQALGYPPHKKYQKNGGPSPEDIATLFRIADPDHADDNVCRLLDILLYQWISASTDGHAKNLGLLHPGDGSVRLAPLYGACSWLPYRKGQFTKKIQLSMKMGTDYSLKTADTYDALRRTGGRLGLATESVTQRVLELADMIPEALDAAIESLPHGRSELKEVELLRAELAQRAVRCIEIASTTPREVSSYGTGRVSIDALTGVSGSQQRCSHVGIRSKQRCVRLVHDDNDHRY